MPNYIRGNTPGRTAFFTVNTFQRRKILLNDLVRPALKNAIIQTRERMPFQIDAWVLMPDHMHCIWTLPDNNHKASYRWSMIKRLVSQSLKHSDAFVVSSRSRESRNESGVWQRRFWEHEILSESDYINHLNYCYWNPVKHQLVNSVKDWPYSTFHRDVKRGLYSNEWCSYQEDSAVFHGE